MTTYSLHDMDTCTAIQKTNYICIFVVFTTSRFYTSFKPIYHPFFNGKCTQAAPAIGRLALMRADLCARDGRPIAHPRRRTLEKTFFCVVCSMLVYYNDGSFCVCVCIDRRERTSEEKNRASSGVESLQTSLFLLRGRSLRRRRSLCSRLAHNFFFTARSDSHLFDHIRHFIAV